MNYSEQYKHPKWQKRRLDYMNFVMKRYDIDVPLCEWCDDTETQLHLHHKMYHKGKNVWDYINEDLILLCENCHKELHEYKEYIDYLMVFYSDCLDELKEITMILYRLSGKDAPELSHINKYILNRNKRQGKKNKSNV